MALFQPLVKDEGRALQTPAPCGQGLAFGGELAARGESRTEPFGADSARMQGRAKRRILGVFKRARTQQTGQNPPERRRGDFHHGLLGPLVGIAVGELLPVGV